MRVLVFLSRVWAFSIRGFVWRTDGAQILISTVAAAAAAFLRLKDADKVAEQWLAYAALALLIYVALRLFTAPYFIWREDQMEIANLKTELDRPKHTERMRLATIIAEDKNRLAEKVTEIRRTCIDSSATKEQRKAAFHGAERYTDKLWFDPVFRDLWMAFYDSANDYYRWRNRHLGDDGREIGGVAERKNGYELKLRLDESAGRVIRYLLYMELLPIAPSEDQTPQ